MKQIVSYFFVGLGSTLVEWGIFRVLNAGMGLHYSIATALAFIVSTFANWVLGRLLTFRDQKGFSWKEVASIYGAAVVGLLLNLGIMYVLIEVFGLGEMLSKMIATGLVFFWNFFIRKLVIYRGEGA